MSGLLGKQALENWNAKTIYTVPTGKVATMNLNLCNFTDDARKAYITIDAGIAGTASWLEHGTVIPAHGVLERTGLVLSAGEQLRAWDDGAGIAARAHGFSPPASQSGPVKKQQVFKTSGTFTPSQALLDAGGVVEVRCVGGGGSGANYAAYSGGSSGMDVTRMVQVSGPVTVTIGAGGHNSNGGSTSFGLLLKALGGLKGNSSEAAASVGEGSQPGYAANAAIFARRGGGVGGGVSSIGNWQYTGSNDGAPATGGGGGAGESSSTTGKGGSGLCIVTWEE